MSWLLLHGFLGAPHSLAPVSPRGECCLAPWLCGHGNPVRAQSVTFWSEVDRIFELARSQLSPPVHLLGYSLGARVGLALLARFTSFFSSAVLIGLNPGLRDPSERQRRLRQDARYAEMLQAQGVPRFVDYWQSLPLFASQRTLPTDKLAEQRRIRLGHTAVGLACALRTLGLGSMPDLWPTLPMLDLPVALVVGKLDEKFRHVAEAALLELPRANLTEVPGVGHNVVLEAPGFLIGHFLARPASLLGSRRKA